MTDEQKIALLKEKFTAIIQASIKQDPQADVIFLAFFNAVKDNEALFAELAAQSKVDSQNMIAQLQATIASHETKIAELDTLQAVSVDQPTK
jgi:predicted cation transporter